MKEKVRNSLAPAMYYELVGDMMASCAAALDPLRDYWDGIVRRTTELLGRDDENLDLMIMFSDMKDTGEGFEFRLKVPGREDYVHVFTADTVMKAVLSTGMDLSDIEGSIRAYAAL